MFPADSSSASSPFSTRSISASSPETSAQPDHAYNHHGSNNSGGGIHSPSQEMRLQGMPYKGFTPGSNQNYPHHTHRTSPPAQHPPSAYPFDYAAALAKASDGISAASAPASTSESAQQGGTRSEPPKRMMDVEDLPVVVTQGDELATTNVMNRLLLQGDPQYITKQRVETAIRVVLDLLRLIPPSPSSLPISPSLAPILLRSPNGTIITSLERIGTFRSIHLQAGTTTKTSSKKQLQAGPIPKENLLYLETAVYMSGENGHRVYACKRCRMREAKRRQNKDVNRKKHQSNSESDSSAAPKDKKHGISSATPSQDYITGENPEQYDPHRAGQHVEEPIWDPHVADWRHEVVLFNSPPEVQVKDGSCVWLPFRVICYGKCHGEKHGFKVKFTLRRHTGEVIATATTPPIRITDDHKTDAKAKPRIEGMTSTVAQPAVSRARKGRASAASSRRVSPVPSDVESVQSMSEAGAVVQKQTPHARVGKPYERPSTQSPLNGTASLDGTYPLDMPNFHRAISSTSVHSAASLSALPQIDVMAQPQPRVPSAEYPLFDRGTVSPGLVSPGALRGPRFDFTPMGGDNGLPPSSSHSVTSSNVASPITCPMTLGGHDELLFSEDGPSPIDLIRAPNFSSLNNLGRQQQQPQLYSGNPSDSADIEMSHAISSGLDNIFDTSSHASLATSFNDDTSAYSTALPDGSMFSDSGVVPDDMQNFLDFTGGEGEATAPNLSQPNFFTRSGSPPMPPLNNSRDLSPGHRMDQDRQIDEMLATLARVQTQSQSQSQPMGGVPPPQPAPNAPIISTVIPSEGPMAGGTTVAIIGANFSPGLVVLFGDRTAKLERVDPTFIQCQAPPAALPGFVEISIAGVPKFPGSAPSLFKYNMMDTDLMMLALQVKNQYAGSSSDAAYRLAQQIAARSNYNSDQSASSPSTHGPSPQNSLEGAEPVDDLQLTVINFIASLDENAPGSLRRSGVINHPNDARQTLLHVATVMGYHRLVRRLVVVGAHLDLQDVNGYTALGLASLMGQLACVRVLCEAGASYDRPTLFGEMPLDLAKVGEHKDVEALLLSAVWSTQSQNVDDRNASSISLDTGSEVDDDNPSDDSEGIEQVSAVIKPRRVSRKARVKRRISPTRQSPRTSPRVSRRSSLSLTPHPTPIVSSVSSTPDDPPPYDTHRSPPEGSWMSRTLSGNSGAFRIPVPEAVWDKLPIPLSSLFGEKSADATDGGWVAFPAPSWETLQKMASSEEVKLFTQAMAAAAFNAVVQSGATTGTIQDDTTQRSRSVEHRRRKSRGEREESGSPRKQMVKQIKSDRMLYLFWLPILLFVGFWLLVTALPLATGFCLIYARQITRAIKQRI